MRMRQFGRRSDGAPGIGAVMVDAFNITQDRIARSRLAGDPPDVMVSPRLGRMGLFGKKLPCTIELRAAIRAASGDSIIEQRTQTTIRHPVFISDIFFKSGNDPVYPGNSRWIRTRLLDTFPFWQHTIDGYGTKVAVGESYRAYPNPRDINSRIYLRAPDAHETDWVSFQPR